MTCALQIATQQTDNPVKADRNSRVPPPKRRRLQWGNCNAVPNDTEAGDQAEPQANSASLQNPSDPLDETPATAPHTNKLPAQPEYAEPATSDIMDRQHDAIATAPPAAHALQGQPISSADARHQVVNKPTIPEPPQFQGNARRIKDAETFQRQKERRQKKAAFLLDGTTTRPVVAIAGQGSWGQATQQHALRLPAGYNVQMPVRPNRYTSVARLQYCQNQHSA